jgi:ribonuclease-3
LERFPELSEGKLSKMKAFLVSESSLVELAGALDLGSYILLNRGEEKTGGRRKHALLADAYEALIGVLYIDGGIAVAEKFLRRELRQKLHGIDPSSMIGADYKSALQERLQGAGVPAPEYAVVEVTGPDHRRSFRVELRVGGRAITTGEGNTIKLAQQEAARNAIESDGDLINSAVEERRAGRSADQTSNAAGAKTVDPELIEEQSPPKGDEDEHDSIPLARAVQAASASESGDELRAESPDEAFAREASLALRAETD